MGRYPVQAVILAGGRGRRLGKLGDYYQKCILTVNGKPLVEHVIDALEGGMHLREIIIITGYKCHQIANMLSLQKKNRRTMVDLVEDRIISGGIQALKQAYNRLDDHFLLADGNVIFLPELVENLIKQHNKYQPYATISITPQHLEARTHKIIRFQDERVIAVLRRNPDLNMRFDRFGIIA